MKTGHFYIFFLFVVIPLRLFVEFLYLKLYLRRLLDLFENLENFLIILRHHMAVCVQRLLDIFVTKTPTDGDDGNAF